MDKLTKERYVLHKGVQIRVKAFDTEGSEEGRINAKLRAKGFEMSTHSLEYVITKRSSAALVQEGFEPLVDLVVDIISVRIKRRPKVSRSLKYIIGVR